MKDWLVIALLIALLPIAWLIDTNGIDPVKVIVFTTVYLATGWLWDRRRDRHTTRT